MKLWREFVRMTQDVLAWGCVTFGSIETFMEWWHSLGRRLGIIDSRSDDGFSLIEMLVVLGVLATLSVLAFSLYSTGPTLDAKTQSVSESVLQVYHAASQYAIGHGLQSYLGTDGLYTDPAAPPAEPMVADVTLELLVSPPSPEKPYLAPGILEAGANPFAGSYMAFPYVGEWFLAKAPAEIQSGCALGSAAVPNEKTKMPAQYDGSTLAVVVTKVKKDLWNRFYPAFRNKALAVCVQDGSMLVLF